MLAELGFVTHFILTKSHAQYLVHYKRNEDKLQILTLNLFELDYTNS